MNKDKKWLTLNAHGKFCLENFIFALSSNDVWLSRLDYLHRKELINYEYYYPDRKNRHPVAGECLTDLGVHTVAHYYPKFDPHLNRLSEELLNKKEAL